MAFNFCGRSLSSIKAWNFGGRLLINAQPFFATAPVPSRFIVNTKPILSADVTSEVKEERPRLGLRKQNLPPYPHIECVRRLEPETFLPSYCKLVKHGDYEFMESPDGYVQVFVQGYKNPRQLDSKAGYSVIFTPNHPLNMVAPVERRQELNHSKLYALTKVFQQIPENLFDKLCICVDEIPLITFVDKSLRNMSENSFRSVYSGKLNKDLETSMELNRLIRTRQDLTLRMKYVPNDIGSSGMYYATKQAIKAAEEATQQYKEHRFKKNKMTE